MRKLSIVAFVALALAACNAQNQTGNGAAQGAGGKNAAANAPIPSSISGTVNIKDAATIGPGAKLDLKLVDVAQPELPVVEKTIEVTGAPPFQFTLDLDPAKIDRSRAYTVNAILTDGERRFTPSLTSPVLTGGSPATKTAST